MGVLGGPACRHYVHDVTDTQLLPADIPLFPLSGVVLLPGETLPLNVFEPRYLNMVDDARRSGGCLGIIQTRPGGSSLMPMLAPMMSTSRLVRCVCFGSGVWIPRRGSLETVESQGTGSMHTSEESFSRGSIPPGSGSLACAITQGEFSAA